MRDRLAKRRKAVGLSQETLAEILTVDRSTVVRWERGLTNPQPWLRPRLANALAISLDDLAALLDPPPAGHAGSTSVAAPLWDGSGLQAMRHFRQADLHLGGQRVYGSVMAYLRQIIGPRLFESVDGEMRMVFTAAAGITEMAGWMAHDSGLPAVADNHFRRAFAFARSGGDRQLGAHILASMSHLSHHEGRPAEGVRLARQGLDLLRRAEPQVATAARLHAMAARGHAGLGDDVRHRSAIRHAEQLLDGDDHPPSSPWISDFDEASLAAEQARCFRRLGLTGQARQAALVVLAVRPPDRVRSRAFAQLIMIDVLLGQNRIDEASAETLHVLNATRSLGSQLVVRQLDHLMTRFAPYAGQRDVASLLDRLRSDLAERLRPGPSPGG